MEQKPYYLFNKHGDTEEDTMIATALIYTVLAFTGLVGSAIAWEDLRKGVRKPTTKQS